VSSLSLSPLSLSLPLSLCAIEKGSTRNNLRDATINMINEPKRLYDIAMQLHVERYPTEFNDHPFTGDLYYGRAELHRSRKEYEEAYIFYKKCYSNRLKTLRNHHPLIATTLYSLAENYRQSGNLNDAKVYYDQSLLMRVETYHSSSTGVSMVHESHIAIAESQYGLSQWYYDKGNYSDAITLCSKSYEIRKYYLGLTHYLTLHNRQALALSYYALQRYSQCNDIYTTLIPLYKIIYGTHHLRFIASLNHYSLFLKSQKSYSKSLQLFQRILAYQHTIYGSDHPELALTLHNIGSLHHLLHDLPKALEYYQLAYEMKLKCYPNHHNPLYSSSIALSLAAMAGVYFSLGNSKRSLELYYETLEMQSSASFISSSSTLAAQTSSISQSPLSTQHPSLADTLNNLGLVLLQTKQYEECQLVLLKALEIRRQVYGSDHLLTAMSLHNLGLLSHTQMKLPDAKKYYLDCYRIRVKQIGRGHEETKNCEENLKLLKLHEVIAVERKLAPKNKIQMFS
jgi:tetratricopeptide (TPR) repeat protein